MALELFPSHKGKMKKIKQQENLTVSLYIYFDNFYQQKRSCIDNSKRLENILIKEKQLYLC